MARNAKPTKRITITIPEALFDEIQLVAASERLNSVSLTASRLIAKGLDKSKCIEKRD
jgi:hypothetical protein